MQDWPVGNEEKSKEHNNSKYKEQLQLWGSERASMIHGRLTKTKIQILLETE